MKDISWKSCMKLGVAALVVYLCIRYWPGIESFIGILLNALMAIVAGIVIAYVINIPMRFFERKLPGPTGDGTRNRILSLILATVCIVVAALFVVLMVIPELVSAIITLSNQLPNIIEVLGDNAIIATIVPADVLAMLKGIDWTDAVGSIVTWLQSGITSALPELFTAFGVIAAWLMGIIFAFWYLAEKDKLSAQCHRMVKNYLSPRIDEKLVRLLAIVDDCFHNFIVAQCLEAVIFGTLVAVVAFLFGVPNPGMLGALVGVMSLIPMVGAIIGAIIGALIILVTSWQKALLFLVVFIIVSFVEAYFVYRRVVGKRVGLTGMWPLIGLTLGASLFGIAGAFVGVPITSVIFRMVGSDLERRESLPEPEQTPLEKMQQKLAD